jgi:hypothetical protein
MCVPIAELVQEHRPGRGLDIGGRHVANHRVGHERHRTEPDRGGAIVPASNLAGARSMMTAPILERSSDVGR